MARSLDDPRNTNADVFEELATETGGLPLADYDLRSTLELVQLMNAEDTGVPAAVAAASGQIVVAIEAVSEALRQGGRLIYVGAGSSGRMAALDASECSSTFSMPPEKVVALLAGGAAASALEQEAAEDDRNAGSADASALGLAAEDVVVGVSASGHTPYVLSALEVAAAAGARTACVVSAPGSPLEFAVELPIVVVVGSEFIAGSTRLKAGTAQKLVLNMLSTISMIRLGKTYGNLMVDVAATNEKLRARLRRIVRQATGADADEVGVALRAAGGDARVAIVSLSAEVSVDEARARLEAADGSIRMALEP
jgi:N-acetylmuramic acid 6-phosphate etherase